MRELFLIEAMEMKVNLLILIAVSIFLALLVFIIFIYSVNLELGFLEDYGGGSSDLDSVLSPSYSSYYQQILKFDSIFVAGPIMLGIVSLAFIVPNIILRMKKIPTRKYMFVIGAGVLLFFGSSYVQNGIGSLLTVDNLKDESNQISLIGGLIAISFGMVFVIPAIILLRRAKLRIRKLRSGF